MTRFAKRSLADLRAEITALQHCVYLNTGTAGPTPEPVLRAIARLRRRFGREGHLDPAVTRARDELIETARRTIAAFVGAAPEEVAVPANASEAMQVLATGLALQPGDEVVTTDEEHGGGLWPWEFAARHRGVIVRQVPVNRGQDFVERLGAALTPRTRVVMVSAVSHATGTRLPVAEISRLAREHGAWSVVDCAQALSHVPVDLGAWGCDAAVGCFHKWTLAPLGTGFAYVRRDRLAELDGPYVMPAQRAAGRVRAAQLFEYGTRDPVLILGAALAIDYLHAVGMTEIGTRIRELSLHLKRRLAELPSVTLLSPPDWEASSGLVAFQLPGCDHAALARQLWETGRIAVRHLFRPPLGLRISTAAFVTEDELDRFLAALRALLDGRG